MLKTKKQPLFVKSRDPDAPEMVDMNYRNKSYFYNVSN